MGEFDRNMLNSTEEKMMKRIRKHSQGRGSFRPLIRLSMILMDRRTFGRLYCSILVEECRAMK